MGVEGSSSRDEQVSHRLVGWDALEGGLATRLQGNKTQSFTHPLTHSCSHTFTHTQWGILVPVAGLLLYKWSKADPHSQPCVRHPFIPQPSWNIELWVFSGAPCLLGWDCTGAPCGTTLFTPTQGQWSCWLGWERGREERKMGRREKRDREK